MRHPIGGALVLGALAAFASPATAQRQTDADRFHWTGHIADGHWIRIRNLNGAIAVSAGTGDQVEVTAIKHYRRSDPATVHIDVEKVASGQQDVLICALWGDRSSCDDDSNLSRGVRNNDVSVDFRVLLPKGVKVGASTVNGEVTVDGATAEVDAQTVNGSVEAASSGGPVRATTVNGSVNARMGKFDLHQDLDFSTVNGSVTAEFAGDLDADVDLSTVNGRFYTDYQVTVSGRLDPRHLRAQIGKGGPRIKMSTVNGNVELRRRG